MEFFLSRLNLLPEIRERDRILLGERFKLLPKIFELIRLLLREFLQKRVNPLLLYERLGLIVREMLNDFLRLNFEVFLTLLQVFLQRLFFREEFLHVLENRERFVRSRFCLQCLINRGGDKAILGVIQKVGAFLDVFIEIIKKGFER